MSSSSIKHPNQTRAALPGLALVAVLFAVLAAFGVGAASAGAATLQPCEAENPHGPIIQRGGELTLTSGSANRKALKRSRVQQRLIRPANALTGRPTFPLSTVNYGTVSHIGLKGGFELRRGRRVARLTGLAVVVPDQKTRTVLVRGKVAGSTVNLFSVKKAKRSRKAESGELSAVGTARLTGVAAGRLNRKLRLKKDNRLQPGARWGSFSLYSLYKVIEVDDPTGEVPDPPPVKSEPIGAFGVTSAATIKWYVRDTFINYVASGEGTRAENGATADAPSGPVNLSYSFNFPFASGWTRPASESSPDNTLIKANGTVGFRYCHNTINFTASNPEIELDGDDNSRLIFTVNGTDGTAFPDQRAVMVKLVPSRAESHLTHDNGDGTTTVTYEKIPGYIPADATGMFAGFYTSYDDKYVTQPNSSCPDNQGKDGICTEANRPDRFGFFSLTYTFAEDPT